MFPAPRPVLVNRPVRFGMPKRVAACGVAGGVAFGVAFGAAAQAATLHVGPGQTYGTIASAIAASADGDTIQVQAGTYTNDFAEIATKITLQAVGGRVTMNATEAIPNEKAILITDTDVSITGFTFAGARIPAGEGQNGAGIRYQGGNLSVTDCYFHNNQEGILADADPNGTITITRSEFAHNGDSAGPGAGYTHNMYIGAVARFDLESSYTHDANQGHEVKSRALVTIINNTRVVDGPTGTASYSIDLPNGGAATISNDQIEQGPDSPNGIIISYGEEGGVPAGSSLSVTNTLIENDLTAHVPTGAVNDSPVTGTLSGVQVYGLTPAEVTSGPFAAGGYTILGREPVISGKHPY
jgi:hypothetical protein